MALKKILDGLLFTEDPDNELLKFELAALEIPVSNLRIETQ